MAFKHRLSLPRHTRFAWLALALALEACAPAGTVPIDPETGRATATTFSKSYGGPEWDAATAARATSDGGIVFVGYSGSTRSSETHSLNGGDLWISTLDSNGNVEAQRLLGAPDPIHPDGRSQFNRLRMLPDGGFIAVGTNGSIVVSRRDATGTVLWERAYASEAWVNYETVSEDDRGRDIGLLPDGGFWVAADSVATLRDTRHIGFGDKHNTSETFVNAHSVYVIRLDRDGNVRFQQRLMDAPFGQYGDQTNFDYPIIRGTSDGGAILARRRYYSTKEDGEIPEPHRYVLVQRLQGDGTVSWERRIEGGVLNPRDLIQTDDDGDGQRDDGFLVTADNSGCARLVKLGPGGNVEWNNAYDCSGLFTDNDFTSISSLYQWCDGTVVQCHFGIVGSHSENGALPHAGFIRKVRSDGTNEDLHLLPFGTISADAVSRSADGDEYRVTAHVVAGSGQAVVYRLTPADLRLLGDIPLHADIPQDLSLEFGINDVVLALTPDVSRMTTLNAAGDVQLNLPLDPTGSRSDRGFAVLELAPGRFVVAGSSSSFRETEGNTEGREPWIAAWDLRAGTPERILWQARLGPSVGEITALAGSGDGGILAGGFIAGAMRVVKLDANGTVLWQSPALYKGHLLELRSIAPTPDGGIITLVSELQGEDPPTCVTKLNGDGSVQWQNTYHTRAGAIEPVDADHDGARDDGFVLAGRSSFSFELAHILRLDTDGRVVWDKHIRPRSLNRWTVEAVDLPRVRQTSDGGFVVASTAVGSTGQTDDSGNLLPLGQDNVMLVKVSAAGEPEWSRIYGAAFDEHLSDLDVATDGTLIVAGTSESLGEQGEAWLMKLGPDGLLADGCAAFLTSLTGDLLAALDDDGLMRPLVLPHDVDQRVEARATTAQPRTADHLVTARQCLGNVNPPGSASTPGSPGAPSAPGGPTAPLPQVTLTVTQAGSRKGVVTSTPSGIVCGTQLGDSGCSARFDVGTQVQLLAENDVSFQHWDSDCEDNTGGTNHVCIVTLHLDRTVSVTFEPPSPPSFFPLRVAVQGDGRVTGSGLSCRLDSALADCTTNVSAGQSANLVAEADASRRFIGWTGDCVQFGAQTSIAVLADKPLTCFAQFSVAGDVGAQIAVVVSGPGHVHDDTLGIDCRQGDSLDKCAESYNTVRTVALTAVPDVGAFFVGWGGACASFGAQFTAPLVTAQDQTCTAEFAPQNGRPELTVQLTGGSASVVVSSLPAGIQCTPSPTRDCSEFYNVGELVRLRASPVTEFASFEGCDAVVDVNFCEVTMNASRTVTVHFTAYPSAPGGAR